ncbi:hypothetical protein EXIGLDRAFT_728241 [Exidia glandulosa HHB12029]|uniref:Macrofage activating glyco protein n=1 Tax=Exidia glandulosa HHB12029 TaxID=1314781 RepID=A0A165CZN7_EXIGL|nr:hypothetical protein EXIGLDRAFT_728241 [Exidia glandulosa HHB12029]
MLSLATVVALAATALAQKDGPAPGLNPDPTDTSALRLNGKAFPFDHLPFKADTASTERGTQTGYNLCNSTTAGQNSLCQTLIVNSLKDFCLFAPPEMKVIGDSEGETVAWCTQDHGARMIPAGALTGVQFIKTPSYVEVTGHIKQTFVNVPDGDFGGELDSGGQDTRGNPIGGLVYSNNLPASSGTYTQSRVWHEFIGGNIFCMKFCDSTAPNAAGICRHTLDTVGCNTNVPASYVDGVFLSCDGDDQAPVAIGVTDIPKSSNCQTFASTDLWPALPSATVAPGGSSSTTAGGSTPTKGASTTKGSTAGSGTSPSGTTSGSGADPSSTDGTGAAGSLRAGSYLVAAAVAGLVGAAVFA